MLRASSKVRPRCVTSYCRLLVPVIEGPESHSALDVACRLAAERGAAIFAVSVVEVPPLLPLDAHLGEAEELARRLLEQARASGESFGVCVLPRILRARGAGTAIVEQARASEAELIVIGAARQTLSTGALVFGDAVRHVLGSAPCRVLVVAPPEAEARAQGAGAEDRPALSRHAA